ncbi:hypothetical protein [Cuniculiplasma divulgatum]|jgi:hypothetical protein|uniref:hypothetical protein n=1 Tax=Cuniculiplasma divulgatum TaxID=1673428 RepID=UPI0011AE2778|nr:hypothetical protein [Cuniculiplasma divulgatum]MCI2412261.1 hypothetical protein [Cuniculiplasma sp.]
MTITPPISHERVTAGPAVAAPAFTPKSHPEPIIPPTERKSYCTKLNSFLSFLSSPDTVGFTFSLFSIRWYVITWL